MPEPMKVAVVGLGAMGAMAMWRLAKRGVSVTGYDQYAPAHDKGASSGETRQFRVAYAEGSEYTPLLLESIGLWKELEKASGRTIFYQNGSLTIGLEDHATVQAVLANAAFSGLTMETLHRNQMAVRFPQYRLREGEVGLVDVLGGVLRPEQAVTSAVEQAEKLGARVRTHTPVLAVNEGPDRAEVVTAAGTDRYDKVLVAPGPWASKFLPELTPFVQPERLVSIWFPAADAGLFGPARFLPTLRRGEGMNMTAFPAIDNNLVKVNLHLPRTLLSDVEDWDRLIEDSYVDATREAVREGFVGLSDRPVRRESYVEGYTPDHHPIVGPVGEAERIIALTGFSGHGFKFSPAMGEVAADLAMYGFTDRPISQMAPHRALLTTRSSS